MDPCSRIFCRRQVHAVPPLVARVDWPIPGYGKNGRRLLHVRRSQLVHRRLVHGSLHHEELLEDLSHLRSRRTGRIRGCTVQLSIVARVQPGPKRHPHGHGRVAIVFGPTPEHDQERHLQCHDQCAAQQTGDQGMERCQTVLHHGQVSERNQSAESLYGRLAGQHLWRRSSVSDLTKPVFVRRTEHFASSSRTVC